MKYKYPYDLINGHIIIKTQTASLLIDTGSPASISRSQYIDFAGERNTALSNLSNVNPDYLSRYVGRTIDGLIGTDILKKYDIRIDPDHCHIITDEELTLKRSLSIDTFQNIPILNATVSNKDIRFFLDTGAKLSYLNPELSSQFPLADKEQDFHPTIGSFTTQTRLVPLVIHGRELVIRAGILPESLITLLGIAQVDGILGTTLLKSYSFTLSLRRKKISLEKNGPQ